MYFLNYLILWVEINRCIGSGTFYIFKYFSCCFILFAYLTFAFYIPEYGHTVGRNLQKSTVCTNYFKCICIYSFVPLLYAYSINPLNAELNPICYLLALLGAHHFLHVSRIRVKSLTLRLLMSYIYGAPILDVSRSHTTTHHSR